MAKQLSCNDCFHIGNRTFVLDEYGVYRDVLGGANGITPDCIVCSICGSSDLTLVEEDRPVGEAFNDPRVPCCGRDIADCDCEANNFKEY